MHPKCTVDLNKCPKKHVVDSAVGDGRMAKRSQLQMAKKNMPWKSKSPFDFTLKDDDLQQVYMGLRSTEYNTSANYSTKWLLTTRDYQHPNTVTCTVMLRQISWNRLERTSQLPQPLGLVTMLGNQTLLAASLVVMPHTVFMVDWFL